MALDAAKISIRRNRMKKKIVVFAILILAAVLLGFYFVSRPESLGNMARNFHECATGSASICFAGELNRKVKLSFASNIEAGELEAFVYDSKGNVVYELDKAKALETYYIFDKTDSYTLKAEYTDFVGNYKITVYETE